MFETLLVANRGEIARRIIRTAKNSGIHTVAVYSEADELAQHVQDADTAEAIGPPPAIESYLSIENILAAARRSGAEAVHPGYGFLSENPDFAQACTDAGLIFVGPSSHAIAQMGNKSVAKGLMAKAGIPLLPGYHGHDQSDEILRNAAKRVGFPVLLKAAAGGGGRGIRPVESIDVFDKQLKATRREALSAFGDDAMLIEKLVPVPRHIEVQIFGDNFGNFVHLFERDCSIQRRHQKVIEEAPAPGISDDMRAALGKAAINAARAINYCGAGTVEFIVDVSEGVSNAPFYFLEMNTRLQVEHPVTEMITGLDLVDWQLRVASGQKLPLAQNEITMNGHAIEARLYAENPAKKFFPSPGSLDKLVYPPENSSLRIDSGVVEGDEVSIYYDPLLAKIIAHGTNRTTAANTLADALEKISIAGIITNRKFLAKIMRHRAFRDAALDTGFIGRYLDDLV